MGRNADIVTNTIEQMIEQLQAAGVQTALSVQDLNPPGVLIRPPVIGYKFGGCAYLTYTLEVLAPANGPREALPVLIDLLDQAGAALGNPWATATPVEIETTKGTLPGYRVTW